MKSLTSNLMSLLIVIFLLGAINGCKKEDLSPSFESKQFFDKSSNLFSPYCKFDAAHNVLIFSHYSDISALEDELIHLEKNFPYNRGNDIRIFSTLEDIKNNGWTNGNGNNPQNKVNINDFKELLEDSYPLSDSVLKAIVYTHDLVNPSFATQLIKPVFQQNASYSNPVRQAVTSSNIPTGIKNQILQYDDNEVMIPNHAFDEFLTSFPGYNSLYTSLYQNEKQQLESGMDPGDPYYDNDLIKFEYERLVLNNDREVYIKDALYKMYDSCRMVIIQSNLNEAYASLSLIESNINGFQQPSMDEGQYGLSITAMNNVIPMNMAIIPMEQLPLVPGKGENTFTLELQSISAEPYNLDCPLSLVEFSRDSTNSLAINFQSLTSTIYPNGGYVQYWNFGDGSGSFQENPFHVFPAEGSYIVRLTTFNPDCGCWDVKSLEIFVGDLYQKGCYAGIITNLTATDGLINFSAEGGDDNSSPMTSFFWDFGDGTTETTTVSFTSHQYTVNGMYEPTVTITFANGCSSTSDPNEFTNINISNQFDVSCCDQERDKYVERDFDVFNDGDHKLKIKDRANTSNWGLLFDKMRAKQVFYIKKNNGGWKKQKADFQAVRFTGFVILLEDGVCANEHDIDESNNDNRASCEDCKKEKLKRVNFGQDWGLSENSLVYTHFVRFNGLEGSKFVYFGDPCE